MRPFAEMVRFDECRCRKCGQPLREERAHYRCETCGIVEACCEGSKDEVELQVDAQHKELKPAPGLT